MPRKAAVETDGTTVPQPQRARPSFADLVHAEAPDATVQPQDQRTRIQIVIDAVKEVLGPSIDVALVIRPESENPGRMSELAPFGYEPLRLADPRLSGRQQKDLRRHLTLRADGLMAFGDLIVLFATEENAKRRREYKEEQRRLRERAQVERESPAAVSRELGVVVDDKW